MSCIENGPSNRRLTCLNNHSPGIIADDSEIFRSFLNQSVDEILRNATQTEATN